MNWQRLLLVIGLVCAIAIVAPPLSSAQYSISTVVGGGPNNLPALQASLGFAQGIAFDSAGNAYIADAYVSSQILKVSATGTVTVVAGNGTMGYSGDGGPATSAALNQPESVFVDASGNIFIADTNNSVIREVAAGTGKIQTVAGTGTAGYSGDGGPATSAQLSDPYGVFVDASGDIFIADTDNSVIREVFAGNGNIQTVAGNGTGGYSGDGGAATGAELQMPESVFVDGSGNIFIVDTYNSVIREVTSANGNVQTVAGTYYAWLDVCKFSGDGGPATSAQLCLPNSIFVDASGNLFIADTQNSVIRVVNLGAVVVTIAGVSVSPGDIQTIAGTADTFGYSGDGALATAAELNYPGGIALDSVGDIFIADTDNYVIREVANAGGVISTYVGNHTLAFSGDSGPATGAQMNFPGGVAVDAAGNVYIADTNNSAIRVFNPGTNPATIAGVTIQPGAIATIAGNGVFCAVPAPGGCGDGGAPISAQLNFPYSVVLDNAGNIYVADTGLPLSESSAIRVINTGASAITIAGVTIQPNTIETVAGTLGTAGFAGDGGAPASAQLGNPQGVFVDSSGNIYIADTENSAIRVANVGVNPLVIGGITIQPGTIETVGGTPPTACADRSSGCGDNGVATTAALNFPTAISVDSAGDIFIADSSNSAIRVVNPGTNPITIAGTTIPPGDILTVAGTLGQDGYSGDNGAPSQALLNTPYGVTVDSLGNIFISDTFNSVVREVVGVSAMIQTVAGTGTAGFSGDGGSATGALLSGPQSVAVSGSGIFVADTQNARIRELISNISVSVSPVAATLAAGGTQQFLATVSNTNNISATWQVNGVTGGDATAGTISAAGLYTAPATAPGSAITVTAISDANGTTSGSAQVTIAASGAGAISVSTTPGGVTTVYTTATQAFTANVTGETNTAVTWGVNGVAGGNSTVGTIDDTGLYTGPSAVPSPSLVTITAVSQADPTVSGNYPITIATAPAASQPSPQTISSGGTATFSLSLKANTGSPHEPITLSCLQSTMPAGASCTFTPATVTPGSSAVSFSLAIAVPSASASMHSKLPTWFAVQIYFGLAPLAGIVLLAGKRRRLACRALWLAVICVAFFSLIACGGGTNNSSTSSNPVTYHIQVQGKTAAQPTPVTITTVTLTVQ